MREAIRGRLTLLLPSQKLLGFVIFHSERAGVRGQLAVAPAHLPTQGRSSGEVIRGGQQGRSSGEVIRGGHQRAPQHRMRHQRSSEVIRGHQRRSSARTSSTATAFAYSP